MHSGTRKPYMLSSIILNVVRLSVGVGGKKSFEAQTLDERHSCQKIFVISNLAEGD